MPEAAGFDEAVRLLIRLLHDGELGFLEVGSRMKAPKYRAFYMEESTVRGAFAFELERALREATGADVREDGTLLGPVHRAWLDTKAALGADDGGLLNSTEMCERLALRTYKEALERHGLPEGLQAVVARQAEHVRRTYALLRLYRDEAQEGQGGESEIREVL